MMISLEIQLSPETLYQNRLAPPRTCPSVVQVLWLMELALSQTNPL
jgi:hypothetical protein